MMAPRLIGTVCMMRKSVAENSVTVLIVAKPGPLREGVQALMGAMPQVGTICEIDDLSSMLITDADDCPGLVLLSCGKGVVSSMVEQVKARWPQARCVTLVSSVEQQQEAKLAGVDAVVLNGLPAQKLLETIAEVLS